MENQEQTTPISETQATPQEVAPETPKQKSWLVIGLTALVLFLLGITGYLAYQNYQLKQQVAQKQPIPTPLPQATKQPEIPSPTPTVSQTNNWKSYTFEPLTLSLMVPLELIVHTEEPNPGNDFTAYIQNYAFNAPVPEENAYQLYITWQNTPTITPEEFQLLKDDLDASTVEDVTIGGYQAIKGQVKGVRNRFVTYILKENTKISLFTSEPTQANKELTDKILSTFSFQQ